MQTIFPILRYTDARAAIRWLCTAFGFREIFSVPETGHFVWHAQLSLGTNIILLGSSRDDGLNSPQKLGAATQALYVHVPGIDEHFEKARSAGVEITGPPASYGLRLARVSRARSRRPHVDLRHLSSRRPIKLLAAYWGAVRLQAL